MPCGVLGVVVLSTGGLILVGAVLSTPKGLVILSENDLTVVHGVRLAGLVTLAGVAGLGSFVVAVSVGSIELVPHAIGEPLLVVAVVCGNPIILFLRTMFFV